MHFAGDVSRVFLATVLHGLGTKPAGVLLFFACAPQRPFSWVLPSVTFWTFCYLSVVRFVGDVSRVFLATVLRGLGTKPAWVLLFRMRSPKTFFLGFAWLPAGFPSFCFFLVGSKGNVSAIFLAAVSQWLRDKKPAGVLPFVVQSISRASLLGLDVLLSFSIVRFVGDVSRVFLPNRSEKTKSYKKGNRLFPD